MVLGDAAALFVFELGALVEGLDGTRENERVAGELAEAIHRLDANAELGGVLGEVREDFDLVLDGPTGKGEGLTDGLRREEAEDGLSAGGGSQRTTLVG